MGRDVWQASAAARAVFEEADDALGFSLSKLCFEGPAEALRRTELQQPAVLVTSIALLRALAERVLPAPAFMLGHSLGEYTALVAAEALPVAQAALLVNARGRFMQEAVAEGRGAMSAVLGADPETVATACARAAEECAAVVSPANYNSAGQTVIAGAAPAVTRAGALALEAGARRVTPLPVSAPFHCALMRPAAEKLAGELSRLHFAKPRVPIVSNVLAEPNDDAAHIPQLLEEQVTAPVRFSDSVRRLVSLGVERTLEVGPGRVLSGLVARIERSLARLGVSGMDDIENVAGALTPARAKEG